MKDPVPKSSTSPTPEQPVAEPTGISFFRIVLLWTLLIASLASWNYYQSYQAVLKEARSAARHSFGSDLGFRQWAARHGGVYVPVTAETQPNPYLAQFPERDIVTPSGRLLTLINPDFMVRQINELGDNLFGRRGHITSPHPRRLENAADAWEILALRAFDSGAEEWSSLASISGDTYLRLMRPLHAEESCLKCHSLQRYEVGDIMGGIGVSLPWAPYRSAILASLNGIAFGYGGIWLLGLFFTEGARRRLRQQLDHRREVEHSLRQSEARYHSFFQDNQAVMLLSDPDDHRIVDANPAACAFYGYSNAEFGRLSLANVDILPPAPLQTKGHNYESRHRLASGEIRDVEVYGGTLQFAGQRLIYSLVHDITGRKHAEEALLRRTRELEERTGDLERFTYTVSHDLKSPVVTIKSFLGFLEQDLGDKGSEEISKDIGFIRSAAEKMEQLLDELLELSRIDRRFNPPIRVSFQELAREALRMTAGTLADRGIEVRVEPVDLTLHGDRPRLMNIWQNLVDNAAKFMGDQSTPRLEIGVDVTDKTPVFYVRDNGSKLTGWEWIVSILSVVIPSA